MTRNRLVAGIGFRHDTPSDAIVALIRRAIAEAVPDDRLVAIATAADRAAEPSIREAAAAFGLVPLPVERDALEQVDRRVPTRSARIERLRGVGSVAEAAALAVAGDTGQLVLARIDDGQATCALAVMGRAATDVRCTSTMPNPRVLPPPSAGEGGPRVSEGRERGAPYPENALPSPDPLCGPPAPAEGGGKIGVPSGTEQRNPEFERATTAQIATPTA